MSNIKDVAKKAGVSISTVSYAINNIPKVSAKTKEKILKIAEELNYFPNTIAQSLKKKKTETIGLFISDISSPYYLEIMKGIQEAIIEKKYDLIVANIYQGLKSTAYTLLRDRRVDGGIIFGSSNIPYDIINNLSLKKIPIVVDDRNPDEIKEKNKYLCSLLVDNYNGAFQAVNHLISLGNENIYFLGGIQQSFDNKKRFEGYIHALEKNNITYHSNWYLEGNFREKEAYKKIKNLIKSNNIPDAVFSANDQMAIGAIHAFQDANIRVPEDVAIVGFDDIYHGKFIQPSLTTIWRDAHKMGKKAVHLIFKIIEGKIKENIIIMPTKLIIRESCGSKLYK